MRQHAERPGTEGRGGVEEAPVDPAHGALDREHVEGQRDEDLREDDGEGREGDPQPERLEQGLTDEAASAVREEQRDAPTTGGSTTGTVITARSHVEPRPSARESSHARGVPSTQQTTTVTNVVTTDSLIAGRSAGSAAARGARATRCRPAARRGGR